MPEWAAVFAGGVLGACARAGVAEAFPHDPTHWPWATFVVNLVGAAILGWVVVRAPAWRRFVGTGICGALTTFSTFQVELLDLHAGLACAYAAASLALGIGAVRLGETIGGGARADEGTAY
jgi:CrcB protein